MKYRSVNELEKFDFHDAELKKIYIQGKDIIWILKNAVITVNNSQNNCIEDMTTYDMKIIFKKASIRNMVWLGSEIRDDNGKLIEKKEDIMVNELNAINELKESLEGHCYILGHSEVKEQKQYSYVFTINSIKGVFEIIMQFENVVSEWNKYDKTAWYEKK